MPAALAPQPNEISMQINRVKRKLIDCAHFVPEDVASGDLSDSADFRIYKLRISNAGLGSTPPSRHHRIKQLEEARTTWAVAVMAKYAQSMPELKKFGFVRCGFLPQM
jgi:hypothetical protein